MRGFYLRIARFIRTRIVKRWGSSAAKRRVWDVEFASGLWARLEHTADDPVYDYLERYADGGNVLDLGCGSGNTGSEMNTSRYARYTGVDVSSVALRKAESRVQASDRKAKNVYVCGDLEHYLPTQTYDVILFRESLFYVATGRITAVLDRYSFYLKDNGVFIVRLCDRRKYGHIISLIQKRYRIIDQHLTQPRPDIILVFQANSVRPSRPAEPTQMCEDDSAGVGVDERSEPWNSRNR
jgi:SAM-dependent methyltransferase